MYDLIRSEIFYWGFYMSASIREVGVQFLSILLNLIESLGMWDFLREIRKTYFNDDKRRFIMNLNFLSVKSP